MAYGPVYQGQIDVRHAAGSVVTVVLLKEGYTGSVSDITLSSPPIEEQGSKSGSDELVGLRPRMGAVRLPPDETAVVDDVYSDDTPWRVRIEIDGSLDVVGPVRKQLRTKSDDKFPTSALKLRFNDGLGPLRQADFVASDGTPYTGRRSVMAWITEILRKTNLGLQVAAASEWFTPSMSAGNPLEQEYLSPERWTDVDDGPMSCYEVLEDLAKGKQAFLCQERGLWHVYQRSLYRKDTFTRWVYGSSWADGDVSPSSESFTSHKAVTGEYTERLKGAKRQARLAYPEVDVTYDHTAIDNLLPVWYETVPVKDPVTGLWSQETTGEWTIPEAFTGVPPPNSSYDLEALDTGSLSASEPREYTGWYRGPIVDNDDTKTVSQMLSESISMDTGVLVEAAWNRVELSLDVFWDFRQWVLDDEGITNPDTYTNLAYAKIILDASDGTTYHLKRNVSVPDEEYVYDAPTWTTDSSNFVAFIVEPERRQTVRVLTPDLPADGSIRVEMYGSIDQKPNALPDQNSGGVSTTAYSFGWPVALPIALSEDQPSEQLVSARKAGSEGETYEMTVLHGTGPTGAHPGASWTGPGDDATLTDDWKVGVYSGESPTGLTAAQILGREALYQLHAVRSVLDWDFRNVRPSLTKAVKLPSGERYLPLHTQADYKNDHWPVEAVRLRRSSSINHSFVTETSDDGSSSGGGSTGGGSPTPGGGGSGSWDDISGKPTRILSRSGDADTVTLAPSDVAGALNHDPALADGVQTTVRASGTAADTALVTEQAVREGLETAAAVVEGLADLNDVVLDASTKYQTSHVLAGDGSGAYDDKTIATVLGEAGLGDVGDVATASRSDGTVLQWVAVDSEYQHKDPSSIVELALNDLIDVTRTDYADGDVLAANGTDGYVDEAITSITEDHVGLNHLMDVAGASATDGHVVSSAGTGFSSEALSAMAGDHLRVGDLKEVGTSGLADGQVLARHGGGAWANEGLANMAGDHVDWTDLANVNHSNLKDTQIGYWDTGQTPSEWANAFIADLIRKRGALSVGDVSFGASWRTIKQDSEPTSRDNGDPLTDGDIWIDTDATPVAEAYVWRNGQWNQAATAIGGNQLVNDAIDSNRITADAVTTNELQAGAARIGDVFVSGDNVTRSTTAPSSPEVNDIWIDTSSDPPIPNYWDGSQWVANTFISGEMIGTQTIYAQHIAAGTITATQIKANTITANEITADTITGTEINAQSVRAEILESGTGTIKNVLQVGTGTPHIVIDGPNARIESSNYASGVSGFRVGANGYLEAEQARLRGELQSTVVRKEEVTAVGGEEIVTPASQLRAEVFLESVTQDGADAVIEWGAKKDILDSKYAVSGTAQNGSDAEIQWQRETDRVLLRGDIADIGDRIRFKDAKGGGREQIFVVTEKRIVDAGIVYWLDGTLVGEWPVDTAVTRWEARIRHVATGNFAPYTSYIDDSGLEITRLGRVGGRAGYDDAAYGLDIGDGALSYSTITNVLRVDGEVRARSGELGPFGIDGKGIFGDTFELIEGDNILAWVNRESTALGLVDDPNLTQHPDTTQWEMYLSSQYIAANNTIECYNETSQKTLAAAAQTLDLSAQEGTTIEMEIHLDGHDTHEVQYEISVETATGVVLKEAFGETEDLVDDLFLTFSFKIESSVDASATTIEIKWGGLNGAFINDPYYGTLLESMELYGKGRFAEYAKAGISLFDDSKNKTFEIDRLTGDLSTAGRLNLGFSGAGLYLNANGEIVAEDEAGNTTQLT